MDGQVIAKVAVAAATFQIDRPYDYLIPPDLVELAVPGVRVLVSFGRGNRRAEGIILAVVTVSGRERLKQLLALLDDTPVLDEQGIQMALWMRDQYFCTVCESVKAMLPAGLWFSVHDQWRLAEGIDREAAYEAAGHSERARRILEMVIAGGSVDRRTLTEAFPGKDINAVLKQLVDRNILVLDTSAARGVGDKTEQIASLAVTAEEALAHVTPKRAAAPLQYAVIE
ncbi:MAG: Helicase PriA essential for oriC/DnaA-independent replication, partial [Oscillospiraceae bacterium]|nr:Helicase PriA essential for oriC/DnaA-independent replication [Oscillospiraceae bacterium]